MNKEITKPTKAIRAKCLDCCCGSANEVRLCPAEDCPLYPFRFGKNPYRQKRELTEEQRQALADRLAEEQRQALADRLAENRKSIEKSKEKI